MERGETVQIGGKDPEQVHYLPHHAVVHHAVVRSDKTTTKLRIVYDASAGPSLNECLHKGQPTDSRLIALAFLMIAVNDSDRGPSL